MGEDVDGMDEIRNTHYPDICVKCIAGKDLKDSERNVKIKLTKALDDLKKDGIYLKCEQCFNSCEIRFNIRNLGISDIIKNKLLEIKLEGSNKKRLSLKKNKEYGK